MAVLAKGTSEAAAAPAANGNEGSAMVHYHHHPWRCKNCGDAWESEACDCSNQGVWEVSKAMCTSCLKEKERKRWEEAVYLKWKKKHGDVCPTRSCR